MKVAKIAKYFFLYILLSSSVAHGGSLLQVPDSDQSEDAKLLRAVHRNDLKAVLIGLEAGADPNRIFGRYDESWAMCAATKIGHEAVLEALVNGGGNVSLTNRSSSGGITLPIVCTYFTENIDAFRYLLNHGAEVNVTLCDTCTGRGVGSVIVAALDTRSFSMAVELLPFVNPTDLDLEVLIETIKSPNMLRTKKIEGYINAFENYLEGYGIIAKRDWDK